MERAHGLSPLGYLAGPWQQAIVHSSNGQEPANCSGIKVHVQLFSVGLPSGGQSPQCLWRWSIMPGGGADVLAGKATRATAAPEHTPPT